VRVEVTKHTSEPDGSYKHHFLRVVAQLPPTLSDGIRVAQLTAHSAVASTSAAHCYKPKIETVAAGNPVR
jgi:hypothetical protein